MKENVEDTVCLSKVTSGKAKVHHTRKAGLRLLMPFTDVASEGWVASPALLCTCADETGESPVDDVVVVGQYKRTPRLNLQTVLLARNCLSAVKLCHFKVLGTQPGFVDNLKKDKNQKSGG